MNEQQVTSVQALADGALHRVLRMWWRLPSQLPDELQRYSLQERLARGRHLERIVDHVVSEAQSFSPDQMDRDALRERFVSGLASLARSGLGWREDQVALLQQDAMMDSLTTFGQQARAFDAGIGLAALVQAGRNVAVMNGLQLLLGLDVSLTRAMLGYSLLYPYSDNYLDDPAVAAADKRAFGARFRGWLEGESAAPANPAEEPIRALVAMIEDDLPRGEHPGVWEALLLIHQAQQNSVRLVNDDASPYEIDVLRLSLAKGGASVLADGYLIAAGHTALSDDLAEGLYGLGACLQLADDMQDVQQDMADGLQTIFSQTAVTWPLDGVASRTCQLTLRMLDGLGRAAGAQGEPVVDLMRNSIVLLLTSAIADTRRLYSRAYVLDVEDCSPFTFLALTRARRRLERQRVPLLALGEAMLVDERSAAG